MKKVKMITSNSSFGTRTMLGALSYFTLVVWLLIILFARSFPLLLGLGALAYGLGLRHAVDIDHIAAIDTTTRKLLSQGRGAASVGFFFSLGHSLVVIMLSSFVAFFSSFVHSRFTFLGNAGAIIGPSFSALFLIVMGAANLLILKDIVLQWKAEREVQDEMGNFLEQRGILTRLLKPFFRIVTAGWHMLFIGFLFGLGFDTATEIGLLGISALTATSGMPALLILLFPLAFTAGMMLVDTLDGIFMLKAYASANIGFRKRNIYNFESARNGFFHISITLFSAILAFTIGGVEMFKLLSEHTRIVLTILNLH